MYAKSLYTYVIVVTSCTRLSDKLTFKLARYNTGKIKLDVMGGFQSKAYMHFWIWDIAR